MRPSTMNQPHLEPFCESEHVMTTIAKHWIDGEWIDSDTVAESMNPATGEVLGQWYDGGEVPAASPWAAWSPPTVRPLSSG
jgi:hypothetical protein